MQFDYERNTIAVLGGVETMSEPVLRITQKKYGGETTILSMRITKEMLRDIDAVANATGRNRNEIMISS